MDNNQNQQFDNSGGSRDYSSPEAYNPDAQYGFTSTSGSYSDAQSGSYDSSAQQANDAFGQTGGSYNLNGQQVGGDYNNGAYNNSGAYDNNRAYNNSGAYDNGGAYNNGNAYSNSSYSYSNGNYSTNPQGNAPLDKKGRPLPNNFGMKLTFSIIEIVFGLFLTFFGSWCFGLVPLLLSVTACVLVCIQNSKYHQGDWNSFRGMKNASTVLLWIAFGLDLASCIILVIAVILVLTVGAGYLGSLFSEVNPETFKEFSDLVDGYESDSDYDYSDQLEDILDDVGGADETPLDIQDSDAYELVDGESLYIDDFNKFKLNGAQIELPMSVEDFCAAGFSLNTEDAESILEAGTSYGYSYYDGDDNYMGTLFIYNVNDEDIRVAEGIAAGITINSYSGVTLELAGGITFDSTDEDAIAAYGNPTGASGQDGSLYLEWYMNGRYSSSLELDFWDGKFAEVWVMNPRVLEE